jgi:hypothetical protein
VEAAGYLEASVQGRDSKKFRQVRHKQASMRASDLMPDIHT